MTINCAECGGEFFKKNLKIVCNLCGRIVVFRELKRKKTKYNKNFNR